MSHNFDPDKIKQGVKLIIEGIGDDPNREELQATPERVARMCREIFAGTTREKELQVKKFNLIKHDDLIIIRDIPFYSVCEHHLLPFFGYIHIAYVPQKGIISGLSGLVRIAENYARRLQLQERLTKQIADHIIKDLDPQGTMVVIEAEHLCLSMRGVAKPGSVTVTSAVRGVFRKFQRTRLEALSLMRKK